MIKLACNYLEESLELVNSNKIKFDYLKYPSISKSNIKELEEINKKSNCNILLHGLMQKNVTNVLSKQFITLTNIPETKYAIDITKTPGISLHLDGGKEQDEYDYMELLEILKCNIKFVKETFPGLEFYSLENKDNCKNRKILNPEFISEAIELSNCEFLLDLSHAKFASNLIGIDFYNYLDRLPLNKINEIHINGWEFIENKFISHIKISNEAYDSLKYVLGKCNPKILTLEYGFTKHTYDMKFNTDKYINRYNFAQNGGFNTKIKEEILEQIEYIKMLLKNY